MKISEDNTRCSKAKKFYAITDKGFIYGKTPEEVQARIDKKGAKEKVYMSDEEHRRLYLKSMGLKEEDIDKNELPF